MARTKVRAVTAYVPLTVQHMSPLEFGTLGLQLTEACDGNITVIAPYRFEDCWLAQEITGLTMTKPVQAANERATDRFATKEEHVRSNIIQHSPIEWVRSAAWQRDDVDIWVWFGFSLLKQGDFTGKRIRKDHVRDFLEKVSNYTRDDIPFPGITPPAPVNVHGDNWRFCGSTLILPTKYLLQIERSYKAKCRQFIRCYDCVPIDLAIWPMVERDSGLPFRFYQANHDHTQLTNFPG